MKTKTLVLTFVVTITSMCSQWVTDEQNYRSKMSGSYHPYSGCIASSFLGSNSIEQLLTINYSKNASDISYEINLYLDANCETPYIIIEQVGSLTAGAVEGEEDQSLSSETSYNGEIVSAYKTNITILNTYATPLTNDAATNLTQYFNGAVLFQTGETVDISELSTIQGLFEIDVPVYMLSYMPNSYHLVTNDPSVTTTGRASTNLDDTTKGWLKVQ